MTSTNSKRGQTAIDFLTAVSIFIVVTGAVFVYAPGLFEPFTDQKAGTTVASNRAADTLTDRLLTRDSDTVSLDKQCTVAFFDMLQDPAGSTTYDTSDCQYDTTSTLRSAVGLGVEYRLRATIVDNTGTAISKDGVTLQAGQTPTQSVNVVVAQRTVEIDNQRYDLQVEVW